MWMVEIHSKPVDEVGREREREKPSLLSLHLQEGCPFPFATLAYTLSSKDSCSQGEGRGVWYFCFSWCREKSCIQRFLYWATCTASVTGTKIELPVQACLYLSAPMSELNLVKTLRSVFRLLRRHFQDHGIVLSVSTCQFKNVRNQKKKWPALF